MEVFRAVLEAVDHERNCARSYRLQAGRDLFGDWMVEIVFGRIGTRGRLIRYYTDDESGTKRLIREKLRDRGTALTRIGIAYRLRELDDPCGWSP